MRILVVEDDAILLDGLKVGLSLHCLTVEAVSTCEDARAALAGTSFDALVLDLMLPDGSGLDILHELRQKKDSTPILLLTARDQIADRIVGLDAGADDYLGKPFDLDEVAARLRALSRRSAGRASPHLSWSGIVLDPGRQTVAVDGRDVALSRREFMILAALMENAGTILSKDQIEARLYGWQEDIESNAVEVHIHNLRAKVGKCAVQTVRGVGYRMGEGLTMASMRKRLFIILISATSLIWLCAILWTYVDMTREFNGVLDTRLMEAARMVASLVTRNDIVMGRSIDDVIDASNSASEHTGYEHQLSCQIWSFDGKLVGKSRSAPASELSGARAGFSERVIDGEPWHVYAVEDRAKGVRVLVGDRLGLRNRLAADMVGGLVVPVLLIVPALALLIWASLGRGLAPLRRMAEALERRGADDLSKIDVGQAPVEVRPVATALNGLFDKVAAAREHERSFTAFAAHELKTPIAGLRTQVQIALSAQDPDVRSKALRQTLASVDRTSRLVHQLLVISQLDAAEGEPDADWIAADRAIALVVEEIGARTGDRNVAIDASVQDVQFMMNRELLYLMIKNLHENAVHHSSGDGGIRWFFETRGTESALIVEDHGPGIHDDEMVLVTQRFYRGRNKSAMGSGLGLAIVERAATCAGAELRLRNSPGGRGLRAEIVIAAPARIRLRQPNLEDA